MSDTNKKTSGAGSASSSPRATDPAKKGAAAPKAPGKFWVDWFDPRALAVLGVLLIALCCIAAVIALWANNAAQPVAITRPAAGAALEVGKLGDIEGTAAPGAQIKLFDGSTLLGEARADSSGRWNFAVPAGLPAGGHTLRADALDAGNRLTSATVAWTLVDPSAVARATEIKPTLPPPTAVPATAIPPTPAPPALIAPSFGVLPGIFPPPNPLKEAPAGVKGVAYDAVTELTGTAGPNARVRLFDGDKVIGETSADAKGNWSVKIATPFALGPHSITAAAVDGAVIGPRSVALAFTLVPVQAAAVTPTQVPVPTKVPEPTKAIEPTKAVTAAVPAPVTPLTPTRVVTTAVPAPSATLTPTKAPEPTQAAPAAAKPVFLAPPPGSNIVAGQPIEFSGTAAPGATVQIIGADGKVIGTAIAGADGKWTFKLPAASVGMGPFTVRVIGPNGGAVDSAPLAVNIAPAATVTPAATATATKAPEPTKAAPAVAPTATAAATKAPEATKAAPAAAATAAPTNPPEATKVVAQAATAAPTKAPESTATPRVLLGVTGAQPEGSTALPIVIGAAAVLALAALALTRRRIR